MHIMDLRRLALLWLHKTEEVRADMGHWARNITGDIYEAGWISEMYGYSFGAAEVLYYFIHYLRMAIIFTSSDPVELKRVYFVKLLIMISEFCHLPLIAA